MKAKMFIAAIFSLLMSASAFACPDQKFDPNANFRWLLGGQFQNTRLSVSNTGLRPFVMTSRRIVGFLGNNDIDLDRWVVRGGTKDGPLFNYTGTGTRNFAMATQKAASMFIPVRRPVQPVEPS